MNVIVFEREGGGRNQKATACSKDILSRRLDTLFNDSKEKGACYFTKNKVVTFRVILLRDVHHATYNTH